VSLALAYQEIDVIEVDRLEVIGESARHPSSAPWLTKERQASLAVDVCSMMDATFGRHSLVPEKDVKGFLREAGTRSMPALAELKGFEARMDGKLMTSIREIRNQTGAHLDPTLDPMDADAKLDSLNVPEVLALMDDLSQVLKRTWAEDVRTRIFLVHGQRSSGALGTEKTDLVQPYND
jgi:hypothetical protein